MVKTTTETYCDDDETIEFFSEFYSYCAERLKMKTTTTEEEEEEEETISSSVLEDVTRLVIFFDDDDEEDKEKRKEYLSLEKKRVERYRDLRRRSERRRKDGEKRTTNVFAGVEELLAVIAEKTTTHEKKKKLKKKKEVSDEDISNKKDTKNDTLRKAWEQIVPKEHFVNAMLNADVSDSRIKNANKAMAEMFKECVEMECSSTTSDAPATSFFETGEFLRDSEEVTNETNAQKYYCDLERASEEMRTLLNACERADLILKKRLYERLVLEEHQKEKEREIGAVEMFARGCCLLPHRKGVRDREMHSSDKNASRSIVLASTCLQILSRRGYADKCANAIAFVHFREEEREEQDGKKFVDQKDESLARVLDSISDTRACCKVIESVVVDVFGRKKYTSASRDCERVLRQMLKLRFWKCETTRYFMGEELLLRKGCPRNVLPSLLRLLIVNPLPTDYLADEKNGDEAGAIASENVSVEDFKHAIIVSACELWASKEFVVGSSAKAKGHLAAIINATLILSQSSGASWEKFVNGIESGKFNDGTTMTSYIVDGISFRLESSSAQNRAHASRIAKQFSLAMNTENPTMLDLNAPVDGDTDLLDPDEGEDDDDDDDDGYRSANEAEWESNVKVTLGEYDASKVLPSSFYEAETVEGESKREKGPTIDIEEVDEQDEEDDSEEDDEEFRAYDIDSDDDDELTQKNSNAKNLKRHLKQLPKPRTLREALNALRRVKPSQHIADADLADAQEGAVYALAEMFETVPDELFSVAGQFSIALLHANPPTPSVKALEISRMNGLTRLFENAPEESIPTAIGHAFDGTSCDSSHKLEVLSCIAQAAKTLSALPPPSSSASLEPGESEKSAIAATSGKTRVFAPKALENQNRGIGRIGHRTRSALIGPTIVAPLLVSLSSQLEKMADLSSSIGSEAIVLSAMLDCIGECCCRTQNAVNSFNTSLATLATLTKHDSFLLKHCNPSVRSSALVACARALMVVPDIMAKEELMLSLQECHNQEDDDSDRAERHETKTSKLFAAIEKITSIARIENARGVDEQCRSAGVFALAAARDVVKRATENTLLDNQNDDPEKQQHNLSVQDFVLPKTESKRFQQSASQVVAKAMEKLRVNAPVGEMKKKESVRFA